MTDLARWFSDPGRAPRTAIVGAHPDDETIGAGGRLARMPDVHVVHVTDGGPRDLAWARLAGHETREAYARARREEALAALALAGLGPGRAIEMGRVDQEAALDMPGLARDLARLFRDLGVEVVVTHPYEGGHPDHDATALAVHAARALLEREGRRAPAHLEFASYHARDGGRLVTGEFLPGPGPVEAEVLDEASRELKRAMFRCFATQQRVLADFRIDVERFREAPRYDFTSAPHEGILWSEVLRFPLAGEPWRAKAREALAALGL